MPKAAPQRHPPPHVFVGCSSAALPLGRKIKKKLETRREIVATVWDENLLELGGIILDNLLRYVSSFDFAVLVLSADDFTSRETEGKATPSPRDNVLFELGLFMGVRGRRRTFAIISAKDKASLKIPTDLDGYIALYLDPDKLDDDDYLTTQVKQLRDNIKNQAKRAALSLLPSAALASGYFNNFLVPIYEHLTDKSEVVIANKKYEFHDYALTILLPRSLDEVGTVDRDKYVTKAKLLSYQFSKGKRDYGFYVYPPGPDGIVRFADYPTTLRSSADIIRLYLQEPGQMGDSDSGVMLRKQMQEQEITNFRKALDVLLEENGSKVPGLRKKLAYQYI